MRLIATDIIEGVVVELYPYGKLHDTIMEIVGAVTKSIKNNEEVTHQIIDLENTIGNKYGRLVIGPGKEIEKETEKPVKKKRVKDAVVRES